MKLTQDEAEQAARRLFRATQPNDNWDDCAEPARMGYRMIARDLAEKFEVEKTAGSLAVFMTWMGDGN